MTFPFISSVTAGLVLILQIVLAFVVSGTRGKLNTWIGDGGHEVLQRTARRHANLAENAGIFVAGFTMLELSRLSSVVLIALCSAFVVARLAHAIGLSRTHTSNAFRLIGGVGTYLIGLVLGATLIWVGVNLAIAAPVAN